MLKMKSVPSPILDAVGRFSVPFDEFAAIRFDPLQLTLFVTTAIAAGVVLVPMTTTTGLVVGQTVLMRNLVGQSESAVVAAINPGVSMTVNAAPVNAYPIGSTVTVVNPPLFPVSLPVTTATAIGDTTIPMTTVTGFAVGQTVLIRDNAGHSETRVITTVNGGVSIVVTLGLTNAYALADLPTVRVIAPRVSVAMSNPLLAALTFGWTVTINGNVVTVTVNTFGASGGPALPLLWTIATTANVLGAVFTIIVDGE